MRGERGLKGGEETRQGEFKKFVCGNTLHNDSETGGEKGGGKKESKEEKQLESASKK